MSPSKNLSRLLSIGLLFAFTLFAQRVQIAQPDRIAGRLNPGNLASITGNIHPKALPGNDRGRVSASLELDYITLSLKPTRAQQADLDRLLAEQQDPASPNHRKWLTPEQYADRFGASKSDIAQIVAWLEGQKLTVIGSARGRNFVVFKGTAGQVEAALRTEIHHFLVDGEMHYANATEPSVPAAILPFTIGFSGLDDFKWKPTPQAFKPLPGLSYNGQNNLAPGDLWVIYDLVPVLFNLQITGGGMTLAVIGQSDVNLSDIQKYRDDFGLPQNLPVPMLVPGATNPGVVNGDSGESDLDLELTGAIAPYAEILFVYSGSVINSVVYAIDQAVAPVISYSYAGCEANQSKTVIAGLQPLAQQANAQGITWLAASGDFGAASCDSGHSVAQDGIAVMMPASIPEVTGVGGTTFGEGSNPGYWTTNQGYGDTAVSYIPEVAWNDSSSSGLASSGGGISTIYPRPTWQNVSGVTGANRQVPDLAMAASANHDGYFAVENALGGFHGGTSAATPVFAGIVLLMNEYLGTNGLGNINPNLYKLAAGVNSVFHDITSGGNLVPCVNGTNGCVGGMLGYSAGPGYDMVTGLGSVDAYNLMQAWPAGPPAIAQIFNGASFVDTGLSPGLIFTVKGSGFGPTAAKTLQIDATGKISTLLAGVQLLVNNTPAPIIYASATQINAIVPYEIANMTGQRVNVQVVTNGVPGPSITDLVVSTAPAMFNLGNNLAAVINQDGTVNGPNNPAARGDYISIYATGEGQTNPGGIDGLVVATAANLSKPNAAVSVSIGQVTEKALYAGTASYDGFFQVNAVIPQSLAPGSVPITVTVGAAASPTLNIYVK
jgi:uncharacterized protein (TIGR03437 family)